MSAEEGCTAQINTLFWRIFNKTSVPIQTVQYTEIPQYVY